MHTYRHGDATFHFNSDLSGAVQVEVEVAGNARALAFIDGASLLAFFLHVLQRWPHDTFGAVESLAGTLPKLGRVELAREVFELTQQGPDSLEAVHAIEQLCRRELGE